MNDLIKEALDYADKIMSKPDVPDDKILPTMNRLAAIAMRLRYKAVELKISGDKGESQKYDAVARSLEEVIRVLKINARAHFDNRNSP